MNTEKLIARREKALKKELAKIAQKKELAVVANKRLRELNKVIKKAQAEIHKIHNKLGLGKSAGLSSSTTTGQRKKYRRTSPDDVLRLIAAGVNSYEKLLDKTKVSRANLYQHLKSLGRKIEINNAIRPAVISIKK